MASDKLLPPWLHMADFVAWLCSARFAEFDTAFVTRLENQLLVDFDGLGLLPIQTLVVEVREVHVVVSLMPDSFACQQGWR